MKHSKTLLFLIAASVLLSCSGSKTERDADNGAPDIETQTEVENQDPLMYYTNVAYMADVDVDSIIDVENETFKSPMDIEKFLSLHETRIVDFLDPDADHTSSDVEALRLLNRILRMDYFSYSTPLDEWTWYQAVNVAIAQYCDQTQQSPSHDRCIEDMVRVVADYEDGPQMMLNQYAGFLAVIAKYRSNEAYDQLFAAVPDSELNNLLFVEQHMWVDLRKYVEEWYVEHKQSYGWYSMLPLEIAGQQQRVNAFRTQCLHSEQMLFLDSAPYKQQYTTVRASVWKQWLSHAGSKQQPIQEAFDAWYEARTKIKSLLNEQDAKAYDCITADLHAFLLLGDPEYE